MSEPNWRELFKAAILELDPRQLQIKVKAADDAMNARLTDPQIPRKDIEAALSGLRGLKRLNP
ncbi:MAG: hypothetical protein WCF88_14880 [Candidatus Acidiferrales bacterium]|jgi:hypothetical protein